jgi:hypothetical protein
MPRICVFPGIPRGRALTKKIFKKQLVIIAYRRIESDADVSGIAQETRSVSYVTDRQFPVRCARIVHVDIIARDTVW